ncbi:MAG: universal stress protein [Thermodesulfobacteriota bacterium]
MDVPKIAIKNILHTTDLSEAGRHAFAYAASLAHQYNAELTVLHVVRSAPDLDRSLIGYIPDEMWEDMKKQSLEEARQTLLTRKRDDTFIKKCVGKFCEEIQAGRPDDAFVSYDIAVELGHPVEKIIEFAASSGSDMIVMASHGHSTLEDAMLGNTVRRVLRRSPVPVMVVRLPKSPK